MSDLEIIILGSASGLPQPDRTHAAIALKFKQDLWLLDAGEGVCSSMLRCGLDPGKLRGIYITHCHPDHCVGIFMLLQYLHMKGWWQKLDIFLPGGAIPTFQAFMNQLYLVQGQIHPQYILQPLGNEHLISEDLKLQTFPTNHLQRWVDLALPGIETAAFAFRISTFGKNIFYSGDIGNFSDISAVIQGEDLLILEVAHVDLVAGLQLCQEKQIKQLVLTHALPEQAAELQIIQSKARMNDSKVSIAQDGMRFIV